MSDPCAPTLQLIYLLYTHLFTLQFTHSFLIVCFEVFHCEIHDMVPLCKLICYLLSFTEMGMRMGTVVCGDGWGRGQS